MDDHIGTTVVPRANDALLDGFDTPRLHLRPIGEGDEVLYCRLYTDPGLMRHIAEPMTMEAAKRSFQAALKQQSPTRQRWIVCGQGQAEGVGLVGLFVDKLEPDVAEIGVMLLSAGQGKGYGTESMAGVVDRAFTMMPLRLLWIRQNATNIAVDGMMTKLRFERGDSARIGSHERYWELIRERWHPKPLEAAGQTG
ncbi:GNAT family N-acetyltransferase [Cognatiluteimonas profundi]|uniref:GNAT family N-acetyltransferase n=1 Tax=Cognatiluteimonas profundi TaxID=2594501 RepID=UPI00131D52C9|nr:GNAT family N-acetyltransferase [Lysobacter profundi]